ncbi:MAG: SRPBCC family protein [Actinomycetota bacterium]
MSETPATLTFRVELPTSASPSAVYDRLADVASHLMWAGRQSRRASFRLLELEASHAPAVVGDRFSSTGANNNGTFHDRSIVVQADPGVAFGFDTESTLDRKHGKTWHARFAHRYTIEATAGGSIVRYVGEVRPQNYVPYWLQPWMRPMTRVMVESMMRSNLRNFVVMAETSVEQDR